VSIGGRFELSDISLRTGQGERPSPRARIGARGERGITSSISLGGKSYHLRKRMGNGRQNDRRPCEGRRRKKRRETNSFWKAGTFQKGSLRELGKQL